MRSPLSRRYQLTAPRVGNTISSASVSLNHPLSRAERTPEVVAVSRRGQGGQGSENDSCPQSPTNLKPSLSTTLTETPGIPTSSTDLDDLLGYLDYHHLAPLYATNSYKNKPEEVERPDYDLESLLQKVDEKNRIVGRGELLRYLNPEHPFFIDKQGWIVEFNRYQHDEQRKNCLAYARVKAQHRLNPYRKKQLSRAHTSRVANQFDDLAEAYHLGTPKWAIIEMGFPTELTEYLVNSKHGASSAWACLKRFWERYVLSLDDHSSGQAYRANLHTWSSTNPLQPHYHFHTHIPNCRMVEVEGVVDEDDQPVYQLETKPWHRQYGGMLVPFSDEQTEALKQGWRKILLDFAYRHGIRLPKLEDEGKVNVRVRFDDPSIPLGRAKWLSNLAYFKRHPIEDYTDYTIKHPDCDMPPERIQHYDNRTRVCGWLRDVKKLLAGRETGSKKQKRSPFTGKPMIHLEAVSVEGLLYISGGDVGYIDFVKGKPVFGDLTPEEKEWLKKAQCYPAPRPPPEE